MYTIVQGIYYSFCYLYRIHKNSVGKGGRKNYLPFSPTGRSGLKRTDLRRTGSPESSGEQKSLLGF